MRVGTERDCEHCGGEFLPKAPSQRFCSTACAGKSRAGSWTGANNPRYNGGLCIRSDGRALICCPDGSLVLFARAVAEASLRRTLGDDEVVHHVNGDPTDDRPENLQVLTRAEHIVIHRDELQAGKRRKAETSGVGWPE